MWEGEGGLSRPAALLGCRFLRSFSTPDCCMTRAGIVGCGLIRKSGEESMSSLVNTEAYCWLRMAAFPFESDTKTPSFLSGDTLLLSLMRLS